MGPEISGRAAQSRHDRAIPGLLNGRMRRASALTAVLLAGCVLAGCQTGKVQEPDTNKALFWPRPPLQPRIKYVASIRTNIDWLLYAGGTKTFLDGKTDELVLPKAAALDPQGNLLVTHRNGVTRFNAAKRDAELLDVAGRSPFGIAADDQGRIFISDNLEKKVFVYRDEKLLFTIGSRNELQNPTGLSLDLKRKRLLVADAGSNAVLIYNSENGDHLFSIESARAANDEEHFWKPPQAAADSAGNIYVIDQMGCKVNVYNEKGLFLRSFGGYGVTPGKMARPKGIAVDAFDHVYISDAAFSNFQIFDTLGNTLLFVGSGGDRPGKFELPALLSIDSRNRIYVADKGNNRVQIFEYIDSIRRRVGG